MSRRNSDYRTVWVIEWPDGDRETVQRTRSGWLWSGVVDVDGAAVRGTWGSAWSSHLDSVRDGVADAGGRLVREPNPNYVERTPDPWATFRRVMSTLNA